MSCVNYAFDLLHSFEKIPYGVLVNLNELARMQNELRHLLECHLVKYELAVPEADHPFPLHPGKLIILANECQYKQPKLSFQSN